MPNFGFLFCDGREDTKNALNETRKVDAHDGQAYCIIISKILRLVCYRNEIP